MKATIGAKVFLTALLSEGGTYTGGKIIGKLMTVSQSSEQSEATLYADDQLVDSVSEFKKGTMSIGTAALADDDHAMLLGHKFTTTDGMIFNAEDAPPFVGVGYYAKARDVNVDPVETVYVAKWYPKVKFKEPNDDVSTKGESIEYKTPTIEGTVFALENGDWKKQKVFKSETEQQREQKEKLSELNSQESESEKMELFIDMVQSLTEPTALTPEMVGLLIKRITVDKDKEVFIDYNIIGEFKWEQD